MKYRRLKKLLMIICALVLCLWSVSQLSWHTDRNKTNRLPVGQLKLISMSDRLFMDESGLEWLLMPQSANVFHQPDKPDHQPLENVYPTIIGYDVPFDPERPNLKFLSELPSGSSYEAIMKPDGSYVNEGELIGTYNYVHPEGFWGNLGHGIMDVLPHLFASTYAPTPLEPDNDTPHHH